MSTAPQTEDGGEELLARSSAVETGFRGLLESAPDAIIITAADGCIVLVNQQTERLFGFTREELAGTPVEALMPERYRARHIAHRAAYMADPRVRPMGVGLDLYALNRDGKEIPVEISLSPVEFQGLTAVISTIRDITTRKLAEARLRLQVELINNARDAILVREMDGRVLEWNRGAEVLYGWTQAEARGRLTHELLRTRFPEPLARIEARLNAEGQWEGEVGHTTRDGQEVVVESRWVLVRDAPQQPVTILEVNRDVTARRQAETERERALHQLEATQMVTEAALAHLALEPLLHELLNRVQRILAVDTVAVLLLNEAGDTLVARAALGLEEEIEQGIRIPLGGGFAGRIAAERRAVFIEDIDQAEILNPILRAKGIRSLLGVPLLIEGRVLGVLHVGSVQARHFTSEETQLLQVVADRIALAIDRAQLHQESQDAVRLRNEFLSAISHDLGNPVTSVRMYARMLQDTAAEVGPINRPVIDGLVQIESTMTQLWGLVEELLDLARTQVGRSLELHWQEVDIVELIRGQVALAQRTTEAHHLELQTAVPGLIGEWDARRLERVVGNLLSNAVKYSPEGGGIVVRLAHESDPQRPGGWAVLEVRDHGIGIPAADLPHVFERFHRASNVQGRFAGTGIGLAGARQIIEQHGGELLVQSEEGVGTTVRVRLPRDELA